MALINTPSPAGWPQGQFIGDFLHNDAPDELVSSLNRGYIINAAHRVTHVVYDQSKEEYAGSLQLSRDQSAKLFAARVEATALEEPYGGRRYTLIPLRPASNPPKLADVIEANKKFAEKMEAGDLEDAQRDAAAQGYNQYEHLFAADAASGELLEALEQFNEQSPPQQPGQPSSSPRRPPKPTGRNPRRG